MIKIIGCFFLILSVSAVRAQAPEGRTKGKSARWYKKYKCFNDVVFHPDESINQVEFAKQYSKSRKWWDEAFVYLKNANLANLAPGSYPIDGDNVYVKVTEAMSKDIDSSKWESHHNYHDIHYLISGKEMIGITPVSRVQASTTYDKGRDILFYTGSGPYFLASPDRFFIIFSNQAHRPFIKVGGYEEKVKRVVIKVKNLGYKE